MTARLANPRVLVIVAALAPGVVALGWMGLGTRLRAIAATCSPCQKAKEQARLEGLDAPTKPALWAAYTQLAGEARWSESHWQIASGVLSNHWAYPAVEAAGWPTFYRLVLFAALERCTHPEATDGQRPQLAAAIAHGLLSVPPAIQIAIMLAVKDTPLAADTSLRESLGALAATGEPLARKDATALLRAGATVPSGTEAP